MASKIPFGKEGSASGAPSESPVLDKEYTGIKGDLADDHSVTSRQRMRSELDDQVAAFLEQGGEINHVKPHVTADPPKKPGSRYGSRPI